MKRVNLERKSRIISLAAIFIIFLLTILEAGAATYYISPAGSNTNPGTELEPFATFRYAFTRMAGGDTLIVKDGAYTQNLGEWIWSGGNRVPTSKPPNGTPSQYTLIKAQNVRAAVDGINAVDWQYVKVEGFETRNRISVYGGWIVDDSKTGINSDCHHVELKKVFAKDGITVSFAAYITLEDFWAIGNSRYLVHNYKSDYIISNRVVAWMDGANTFTSSGGGAFAHYLTDYSVIAHGLIFDVSTNLQFMSPYGYLYSSRPNDGRNQLHGILAFGGRTEPAFDGLFVVDQSGINQLVKNCVIWGAGGRGIRFNSGLNSIDKVENCTVSNVGSSGVYTNADKIEVRNSILANNGGSVSGGITGSIADGNIFYNTGSIPSYSTNHQTYDPQIRYLPRSPVAGKGASVEKKYAIALVNGEYQVTETTQPLWPWPYEDLIKQDMCANTVRGWCATNKTLTQYVWEYLGNSCPQEICGAQPPDTEPPVVSIASPTNGASVSGIISIQATATDNLGVAGVQFLLDGANLQAEDTSSPYSISLDTTTTPNGTHTISARARDSSGNIAAAVDVTVTVLNGVVNFPPVISGVASSSVTQAQAAITWTTDEPADSQVEYGTTLSYGSLTPLDTSLVANHQSLITGLTADTVYHYRVLSKDSQGAATTSGDFSFRTLSSVSPDCSQANILCVDDTSGAAQEYSTIQAAANAVRAGDTVIVYDGSYAGFRVSTSGTLSAPIVFKAKGTGAIINTGGPTGDGVRLSNASYIAIEGFKIQDASERCIAARESSPTAPMRGITIRNNICINSGREGFYLSEAADSLVEGNTITGSGATGVTPKAHGIYLANAGSDNTIIRGNIISDAEGIEAEGIHINGDLSVGGDGLISAVTIEGNIIKRSGNNGLSLDGVQDSLVQNNLIYASRKHALRAYKGDGAAGPRNLKVINNTFLVPSTGGWAMKLSQDLGGHIFFNNILLSGGSGSISAANTNFASNNNALVNKLSLNNETSIITLSQWQASGHDVNSFLSSQAALFVDPAGNDYKLKDGAPAINAGINSLNSVLAPSMDILGNERPQGLAYDLGAYEAAGITLPPDTQAPTTPANLTATAVSSTQINLSWTASTDDVGVAGYKIYRDGVLVTMSPGHNVTSYSDTGLQPNTTYSYTVSAYDAAGNESARSTAAAVSTLPDRRDPIAPTAPIVIDGGQFTSDRYHLSASWSSTSPESRIVEYRYKITKDSPTGPTIRAWKSAGTNTSVTVGGVNLQWGITYYFGVKAKNAAGLWSGVGYSDGITARR